MCDWAFVAWCAKFRRSKEKVFLEEMALDSTLKGYIRGAGSVTHCLNKLKDKSGWKTQPLALTSTGGRRHHHLPKQGPDF